MPAVSVMHIIKQSHILTNMARKVVQVAGWHLDEWMAIRGFTNATLADEADTTEPTIWRYRRGKRRPHPKIMRAMEKALGAPKNGLYKPPGEAMGQDLLAGLSADAKKEAMRFIGFLKQQSEK